MHKERRARRRKPAGGAGRGWAPSGAGPARRGWGPGRRGGHGQRTAAAEEVRTPAPPGLCLPDSSPSPRQGPSGAPLPALRRDPPLPPLARPLPPPSPRPARPGAARPAPGTPARRASWFPVPCPRPGLSHRETGPYVKAGGAAPRPWLGDGAQTQGQRQARTDAGAMGRPGQDPAGRNRERSVEAEADGNPEAEVTETQIQGKS